MTTTVAKIYLEYNDGWQDIKELIFPDRLEVEDIIAIYPDIHDCIVEVEVSWFD
jgi:hypothetical protein